MILIILIIIIILTIVFCSKTIFADVKTLFKGGFPLVYFSQSDFLLLSFVLAVEGLQHHHGYLHPDLNALLIEGH